MSYDSQKVIPAKLETKKNDLAPIILFIDVIKSLTFRNPIIPLPLRIDKMTNRLDTCLIYPNTSIEKTYNNKVYTLNLPKLFEAMLTNLLVYAKEKYREITFRVLENAVLLEWWQKSLNLTAQIPKYQEDIHFILQYYLDAFGEYLETHDERNALIKYCQQVIDLCNRRITENQMEILDNNKTKQSPMYMKKKDKIYPNVIELDVFNKNKQKNESRAFIPLLIYDDLLECFLSNQVELEGKTKEIITFDQILREFIVVTEKNSSLETGKNNCIDLTQIDFLKIIEKI